MAACPVAFRMSRSSSASRCARVDVEIGERLVEQQQPRRRAERTRERHALLLAARQFVRKARRHVCQSDEFEHFGHAHRPLAARQPAQPEADVLAGRADAERARSPGTSCRCGVFRREGHGRRRDHAAVDGDRARTHRLEACDRAQHGRLPAARRPEQAADVAAFECEAQAVDDGAPSCGVS